MALPEHISIDGPAASGKSTLAERLAERLGYLYFDTGVMYRAVTLAVLERGLAPGDEGRVSQLAEEVEIDVRPPSVPDGRQYDVILDGQDVTWALRRPEVETHVSLVSMYSGVRVAMSRRQREIGLRGKVVMVGRDIGTVILPEAGLKLYLDASDEARAQRRYQECLQRGQQVAYSSILKSMQERDLLDSTREIAPLKPAEDALILDTTALDANQVYAWALSHVIPESGPEEGEHLDAIT
jgi:cytidylate kinase